MPEIVIVTSDRKEFSSLVRELCANSDCRILWDDSMERAGERVSGATPDLMIVDEEVDGLSNLEIARHIVLTNALVNLAVVSSLSHEDFHEASEGLGILAQLPRSPGVDDALRLLEAIRQISSLKGLA
jgi:DNA-binding response OmpR family regulator